MKADAYIIGSTKPENYELITKVYGEIIQNQCIMDDDINSVYAVIPTPSYVDKASLIKNCFTMIRKSDIVIAIKKPDRTFGDGVLYEIAYAKSLGRCVYSAYIDGGDIIYDKL